MIGFTYNDSKYIFKKNLQNDIIGIYDEGDNLVASYVYDAWGNHKVYGSNGVENTSSTFIGNINPFRYRCYYYDRETQLYWVSSRYYSPELCRWMSLDSIEYLEEDRINGCNLYAYCMNNPVNMYDPDGHSAIAIIAIGTLIGALISFGSNAGKQLIDNNWNFKDVDWGSALNDAIVGAAVGFSLVTGVVFMGPVLAGGATVGQMVGAGVAFLGSTTLSFGAGALGYVVEERWNGRTPSLEKAMIQGGFVAAEGAFSFLVGGLTGSVGKIGTKGPKFLRSLEWWGKLAFSSSLTMPFRAGLDYFRKTYFS